MATSQADVKDIETVSKPALESERYPKAGQMSGNSIHVHNSFTSQQTLAPNITESFPARIPSTVPSVFPAIRHPFHSTTVQNPLYPGTNTWRSPHHGVMELGDPHTAQEVLLKQVRQIVASKAPLGFTDKTLPLIQPAKSFQNANILEEMRPREREVVQEKRPPLVAMRNDSIPSPKPLGPENRMGSDDLLSDENIEKMEKSYSDDEGKKLESDFTGLESQEEMENLSQGRNSTHDDEDDDDHDSFASFLEHETSESMKGEKMLPPSVISSSRNTPISIPTPEKASVPLGKIKHIFDVNSHARLTQLAPREAVERVKTGTKRAPLDLTDANFPKKSKYSRAAPLVPRLQPPKGMNQALHMMRLILQPSFNKELFALVSDYLEIFYQAAGNITNNGSHDRIDEGKVQELVTGMLSEACRALHGEHQEPKLPKMYLVSDTDGHTPMSRQKLIRDKESRPPPQRQSRKPAGERSTSGRQIPDTSNWNPDQITESSKFVLGVRANEAYGYSGYRGKIYYVHPNLFRYNTDNEDRKYLLEHRKLTLQGGRAFLVLYDQIVQIMQTNTYYSDNETVVQEVKMLEDQAFTLPRFILRKVIDLMKDQISQHGGKRPRAPVINRHVAVPHNLTEESSHDELESSQTDSFLDDIPTPECNEEDSIPEREAGPCNQPNLAHTHTSHLDIGQPNQNPPA